MKNIIIIGEPRCGKTTLANILYEKIRCQIIHGDCESVALSLAFPELNIKNNLNFAKYLEILVRKNQRDNKYKYSMILESTDIKPIDIYNNFDFNNNFMVCLGVTSLNYRQFSQNIINNDNQFDWTKKYSKKEIEKFCKEYILNSKKNELECKKLNIKFVDTSIDRIDKLNNLALEIVESIEKQAY